MPRKKFNPNEPKAAWQARLNNMRQQAQRSAKARGFDEAFRSGFELQVAILLKHYKIPYEFEAETIPWVSEPRPHKYTPDFKIKTRTGKTLYIETKGRMEKEDREKHIAVRNQHPELDIRLVFSNPNAWDRKAMTRSYGKWATANGFIWCAKSQLERKLKEWINE